MTTQDERFCLVEKRPTQYVYTLADPVGYTEYVPYKDSWSIRFTSRVVLSLGRYGQAAIFAADQAGHIIEYQDLYNDDFLSTNPEGSMSRWLDDLISQDNPWLLDGQAFKLHPDELVLIKETN